MTQPAPHLPRDQLDRIAQVTLRLAQILMETGSSARIVHECGSRVATGLGAEYLGLRTGYASLAITVASGPITLTRMVEIGRMGVNHRLDHAVRALVTKIETGSMTAQMADAELNAILVNTPRHPAWLVALAVGLACASFGRLFGMDWAAFPAVWLAGAAGQWMRHTLLHRGMNLFVVAALTAFAASACGGFVAMQLGSTTVNLAMMASFLLLVPGVPATNAQADIMDGYPTIGSARAVTVVMIMIFSTTGVWIAQTLLSVR